MRRGSVITAGFMVVGMIACGTSMYATNPSSSATISASSVQRQETTRPAVAATDPPGWMTPDTSWVASTGDEASSVAGGSVRVLGTPNGHLRMAEAVLTPDGMAALGVSGRPRMFRKYQIFPTQNEIRPWSKLDSRETPAMAPNGKLFARFDGAKWSLADMATGHVAVELPTDDLSEDEHISEPHKVANRRDQGREAGTAVLAWSGDGRRIAYSDGGRIVWVVDAKDAKLLAVVRGIVGVTSLQYSPDGALLAIVGGGVHYQLRPVRVWDVRNEVAVAATRAWNGIAAVTGDGKRLVVAGARQGEFIVSSLVGTDTGKPIRLAGDWQIKAIQAVPGGPLVVVLHDGPYLSIVDTEQERETLRLERGQASGASVSWDGRTVAAFGGSTPLRMWTLPEGRPVMAKPGHTGQVTAIASRSGRVLSGDEEGGVIAWEMGRGTVLGHLVGNRGRIQAIDISSKGNVAIADGSGSVLIFDSTLRKVLRRFVVPGVQSVRFASNGVTLAALGGASAVMMDVESGLILRQVPRVSGSSIVFTSDGQWLIGGCPLWAAHVGTGKRIWAETTSCSGFGLVDDRFVLMAEHGSYIAILQQNRDYLWALGSNRTALDRFGDVSAVSADGHLVASVREGKVVFRNSGSLAEIASEDVSGLRSDHNPEGNEEPAPHVTTIRFASDTNQVLLGMQNGLVVAVDGPSSPKNLAAVAHTPTSQLADSLADLAMLKRAEISLPEGVRVIREPERKGVVQFARRFDLSQDGARMVAEIQRRPGNSGLDVISMEDGAARRIAGAWPSEDPFGFLAPERVAVTCTGTRNEEDPGLCALDLAHADAQEKMPKGCGRIFPVASGEMICVAGWTRLLRKGRPVGQALPSLFPITPGESPSGAAASCVTPDGGTLAEAGANRVRISRVEAGGLHAIRTLRELLSVEAMQLSSDGKKLALVGAGTAWIRDVETGSLRAMLAGQQAVTHAVFSPDGRRVATADDEGTVRIWDAEQGNVAEVIESPLPVTGGLAFAKSGTVLITVSPDAQWARWAL